MARIDWKGDSVFAKVTAASVAAVDETMGACVEDAKLNHPEYPPASRPYERYANRTRQQTDSIKVLDGAAFDKGTLRVSGSWGSLNRYALYLEIGTSRKSSGFPTAEVRARMGGGDPAAVPPPSAPPQMAPRPYLRPALDKFYPALAALIRQNL